MSPLTVQLPEWLEACLDSQVAILGSGKSGTGVKTLIEKLGGKATLYDEGGHTGEKRLFDDSAARAAGLVVCSPGFRCGHLWIERARRNGCRVIPEFDLGASLWKGPVIAVTGTNGKTTLTSFLHEAFSHVGIESYAVGNIGKPLCELLAEDCNPEAIAVCEISSFQSEMIEALKADHVLWTNFDEDHLDRHGSMPAYFRSKYKLVANARSDSLFVDSSVYDYGVGIGLDLPKSAIVTSNLSSEGLGLTGSVFETEPERSTYLMGRALWLSLNLAESSLVEAAHLFEKAPHRMQYLGEKEGIRFWDDSKATNFHAVLGGLKRFEKPVVWLGGGESKGGDIEDFAGRIAPKVKYASLIGKTAIQLSKALNREGIKTTIHDSLEEAVTMAFAIAEFEDNIVFSPGFASFDMFENYVQRGEAFRKAIDCL
jgi:UDP-N-acetylmuramoylalanine--D-glutamate ligase